MTVANSSVRRIVRSRASRAPVLAVLVVMVVPVGCIPENQPPPPGKTLTISASMVGTSILTPGGTFLEEVSTGSFTDPVLGDGTYHIDAATSEAAMGFQWFGTVTFAFDDGSTLTMTGGDPDVSPPDVDGMLTIEDGTDRFEYATGELAFMFRRHIDDLQNPPFDTVDSGSITGTISLRRPKK
jgi:hypothetical protein